ncbi:NgoPII family restriction endonuclease [Macrococcus carouselicus]|uniref:NgoPII family restriction endonuclease n=1 Tax=Macrococcus carouselicus TaxID=69969 RepID=A0A9Q8CLN0_9STAP|nr:NgoPII family restriction endonuclease [Macrococcus carouselicus]TDM02390.1 NgoPII family restriction endonuclease [Macrococcus carouselicus]
MTIIDAISNLIENPIYKLKDTYINERNRANSAGDALEEYVKDLFAGTVTELDESERKKRYSEVFSYLGNNSNPPDIILKNSDAIEVKKIESSQGTIQLNSSYPKNKLLNSNSSISKACRECEVDVDTGENWNEKDVIYAIGTIDSNSRNLVNLIFIYGDEYAADIEIYENIKQKIKDGIAKIEGIEFSPTKELGKVKKVDPLGITDLRMRPMWSIANPLKAFKEIFIINKEKSFNFTAIINKRKWNSFGNKEKLLKLIKTHDNVSLTEAKIQDSNNPAKLKEIIVITINADIGENE